MITDRSPGEAAEHLDVLIVGAGLSGIDAAYRLQTESPGRSFAILEARDAIGGTWDLFRYPGIRSDSDMTTLGFPFRPWRGDTAIVDGGGIRDYIEETARIYGIDKAIRFKQRVRSAAWSSETALWTVEVESEGGSYALTCAFLYLAAGYYDFAQGYDPDFAGRDSFAGTIVHPQHWPADLDYRGKRIVVIGSGATAVTLVPSLIPEASHVTMLQRSPTYIVSRPAKDAKAIWLRKYLPAPAADWIVRWKNVLSGIVGYRISRRRPERVKKLILDGVRQALGPLFDVDRDFTPRYNPWDQRVCLVPDGDLFRVLRSGRASIVTDTVDRFTETGLLLGSGRMLDADIIVTATGLRMQMLGGMSLTVDGAPVSAAGRLTYKGMMLDGIPNLAFAFGYTNASWTLKCDLTARYVCRLLNHMAATNMKICVPKADPSSETEAMVEFSSGYIERATAVLPRQGVRAPWKVHQNYLLDMLDLKLKRVDDGTMHFSDPAQRMVA